MTAHVTIVCLFLFPLMWIKHMLKSGNLHGPDLLTSFLLRPKLVIIWNRGLSEMGQIAHLPLALLLREGCLCTSLRTDRCKHDNVYCL